MFSAQYQSRIIPMPDDDASLPQARRRGCRAFARHDGKHRSVVLNEIWYCTWALNNEEWRARLRQAYGKIGNDGSGMCADVSSGTRLFGG